MGQMASGKWQDDFNDAMSSGMNQMKAGMKNMDQMSDMSDMKNLQGWAKTQGAVPTARLPNRSRRRRGRGNSVETSRGGAAAATRIFRGDESRRRRGYDVDIPWRRVAAAPRLRRGYSVETTPRLQRVNSAETSRGGAAATTWIFSRDESRRHRGYNV